MSLTQDYEYIIILYIIRKSKTDQLKYKLPEVKSGYFKTSNMNLIYFKVANIKLKKATLAVMHVIRHRKL